MDLSLYHLVFLAFAGIFAGALNAIAGGGTFFTFPILIFAGVPPILANTTNKVGIWFGSLASVAGYVKEIKANKSLLIPLSISACIGSAIGSYLLLYTPQETFRWIVPWLMLVATLVFAFGRHLLDAIRYSSHPQEASRKRILFIYCGQCIAGIYGGFFGAGIGIIMMALYELMGVRDIHQMNGLKVWVAMALNAVSVLIFIITGAIIWPAAAALVVGTALGGYYGAALARCLPQHWVRSFVIFYGLSASLWFFIEM